jgi:DNA repair exonuclease SbcCD ATPase subunit
MKTLGLTVLFFLTSLWGCNDKNEVLELQNQNQGLAIQLAKSDSLSNVYRSTLEDIESVLDSIIPGDNTLDPAPVGKKFRARLTQKVNEINDLLLDRDKNYNSLNYRLIKSNNLVSEKSAMIEELNAEIKEKESVNFNLKQTVDKLEKQITEQASQIASLILEKQNLNEALETKTNTINSAHYIAGSEDELRNMGIIEKTGGFLGFLGRVNTLNPKLDKNHLHMIDIRERTTFTLNAERGKIEFITNHHPSSYELNESSTGASLLTIIDPVEFWRNSKYLVIAY